MDEYKALAARARNKDADAFAMLYELVYEDMYHTAYYMLGNAHDAQDVVSETVLNAYESIHKLRSAEAFRGWIFRILLNQCKRKRKEYATKKTYGEDALERQGISAEESIDVKQAFLRLEEEARTILTLSLFGGYTSEEIGKYLHMNANTVRTKRSRALGKLQDMLTERKGV